MKTYFLSLTRGLVGYYVKFQAPSEEAVRKHAERYFGQMWGGSVYTEAYFYEILRRRYPKASRVVNGRYPIVLTDEEGMWE